MSSKTRIAVGADEGLHVVDATLEYLHEAGYEVIWYGPGIGESEPWPEVAMRVAREVVSGTAEAGILFCWTGTGVSIAANKVRGIRAALCDDAETARGAKLWNDANVLCLSLRRTSEAQLKEILEAWITTSYKPNETDDACLRMVAALEYPS